MPNVELSLDSSKSVKGLKEYDQAVSKSESVTTSAFERMKSSVGTIAVAAGAAASAVAAAMVTIGMSSLDTASRMEEASNKYAVVFEGMTDQADAWRTNLEQNYNLSKVAATKYLSNTKAILDATGMQTQAAGELSNNMVKLALDLASFSDVPIEDAIQATTAALTGEMEMMKRFGIVIKAEEVTHRAMIDNNYRTAASVTEADKAQAAYNIMLEKGAKAIGDVSRSADSYVTQLNILRQTYDNVSLAIGQQLIPFATQALGIFNQWNQTTDTATVASNAFNTALQWTVKIVQFLYNGFQGLVMIGNTLVVGMAFMAKTMVDGLTLVLTPLQLIGDALVKFGMFTENPFQAVTEGLDKLNEVTETFLESSKLTLAQQQEAIEKTNKAFDELTASVEKNRVSTEKHKEAVKEDTAALDEMLYGAVKAAEGLKEYGNALDMTTPKGEGYVRAGAAVSKMTLEQANAFGKLYTAAESARAAYEKQVATLNAKSVPAARQYAEALKKVWEEAEKALADHQKLKPEVEKTAAAMTNASAQAKATADSTDRLTYSVQGNTHTWKGNKQAVDEAAAAWEAADVEADRIAEKEAKRQNPSSFNARGNLSEEQWKMLPQAERDRLAQAAMSGGTSTWDYFNSPTGSRIKGVSNETQIKARNDMAYQLAQGTTIINNFTQAVSRSDIEAIMNDMQRSSSRA